MGGGGEEVLLVGAEELLVGAEVGALELLVGAEVGALELLVGAEVVVDPGGGGE